MENDIKIQVKTYAQIRWEIYVKFSNKMFVNGMVTGGAIEDALKDDRVEDGRIRGLVEGLDETAPVFRRIVILTLGHLHKVATIGWFGPSVTAHDGRRYVTCPLTQKTFEVELSYGDDMKDIVVRILSGGTHASTAKIPDGTPFERTKVIARCFARDYLDALADRSMADLMADLRKEARISV